MTNCCRIYVFISNSKKRNIYIFYHDCVEIKCTETEKWQLNQ